MAHITAHNELFFFGWDRFYGFGFFGMGKQRA